MEGLPIHTISIFFFSSKTHIFLKIAIFNLALKTLKIGPFYVLLIYRVQKSVRMLDFRR